MEKEMKKEKNILMFINIYLYNYKRDKSILIYNIK